MARVEVLGALCGASVNYAGVRGSGVGALQGVELAGLLSGLNNDEMAWAFLVYIGDLAKFHYCRELVRQHAESLRRRQKWRATTDKQVLTLADIAFNESIGANGCPNCNGVKHVNGKACLACSASGVVKLTDDRLASDIGVHKNSYRATWSKRRADVLHYINELDFAVRCAVARNSKN